MIRVNKLTSGGVAIAAALCVAAPASAQFQSQGVELLSWVNLNEFPSNPSAGNDCWGYVSPSNREYALMGVRNAMAVVEITDPRNPVIIASISHPSSTWGDVKVYQDHCYVSNEEGGGIQVIDLSDVDNGNVTLVRSFGPDTNHNVAIDEVSGYLYTCGGRFVYDLSNPANPVQVGQITGQYLHDLQAVTYTEGPYAGRQFVFGGSENRGVDIYDVTDKNNMFRLSRTSYPGVSYCHQLWLTEDKQYLIVNDELDEIDGYTDETLSRVFDVSDLSAPFLATTFTSGLPAIDHNLYIKGDFCFEANYRSGLRIFDVSDPLNAVETGWFDTYPGSDGPSFDGAWSVFPYFPSGNVIISDTTRGLFVVEVSGAMGALRFSLPNGTPQFIDPDGGTSFIVGVSEFNVSHEQGSGLLHYNDGNGWTSTPMNVISNDRYEAEFPAIECGATVQFYVSVEDTDGNEYTSPGGAPVSTYSAVSALGFATIFEDDFESDEGWTVTNQNVADGAWERAIPAQGGVRGDPVSDFDGSGRCFVTGNGNEEDLDGGPTIITSRTFNLSNSSSAFVSFAAWMYNDDSDDEMLAQVSNNNGNTWTTMTSIGHGSGWREMMFNIGDFTTFTNQMQFRFSVADQPNNSVTEAGIDAFKILEADCDQGGFQVLLTVGGVCINQGGGTVGWQDAQPNVTLALLFARNQGSFVIPNNRTCAGTTLGLGSNQLQIARTFGSGNNGSGSFNATFPPASCGGYLQLIQLSDCVTSNVAQIPN